MQKIVVARPGGYQRLILSEQVPALPQAGEVAIVVKACGVNYADCIVRMGLYASARELHGYPITPGFEISGPITAVGAGVDPALIGTSVLALTLFGGYCSHICLPADRIFPLPGNLNFVQGAAIPTVFLTA